MKLRLELRKSIQKLLKKIPRPWILSKIPSWSCLAIYLGMGLCAGLILNLTAPTGPICGNGVCELNEGYGSCPQDCPAICGNGICERPAENPKNCPQDCGTCGNEICELHEDYFRCRLDCPAACGNRICEHPDENNANCGDCFCGDGICIRPIENHSICPGDCPPILSAKLLDLKLDKPEYYAGETINAWAIIENTGEAKITQQRIRISATVLSLENWLANLRIQGMSPQERTRTAEFQFWESIPVGATGTIWASYQLPASIDTPIGKISLAGEYRIRLEIYVDGLRIGEQILELRIRARG